MILPARYFDGELYVPAAEVQKVWTELHEAIELLRYYSQYDDEGQKAADFVERIGGKRPTFGYDANGSPVED